MDKILEKFVKVLTEQGKSVSTILAYEKDIEQLILYLKQNNFKDFKKVTKENIDKYIAKLLSGNEFTPKTVSRKLNSIETFFRFLHLQRLVNTNISLDIRHPKFENKLPRILSKQEFMALRDATKTNRRVYIIVEILLQTGIRIGELSRLRTGDIKPKTKKDGKNEIIITKYSSCPERKITITEDIANLFKEMVGARKPANDYLFTTKTGRNLLIRNIRSAIDRHFEKAEIENTSVNDLRNTFIVYQLKSGAEPKFLAEYVGHERLSSTYKFIKEFKISPIGNKKKIVEL
ncbi:MAG: tyrosine-type recombinase/integrase [bacterium]